MSSSERAVCPALSERVSSTELACVCFLKGGTYSFHPEQLRSGSGLPLPSREGPLFWEVRSQSPHNRTLYWAARLCPQPMACRSTPNSQWHCHGHPVGCVHRVFGKTVRNTRVPVQCQVPITPVAHVCVHICLSVHRTCVCMLACCVLWYLPWTAVNEAFFAPPVSKINRSWK